MGPLIRQKALLLLGLLLGLSACTTREVITLQARTLFPDLENNARIRTPKIIFPAAINQLGAVIAPGGDYVVYVSNEQGNGNIYRRPLSGGKAKALTTQSADDLEPAFSPDGKYLAYVSMENDAKGDIWLMKNDGTDKIRLTDRTSADQNPVFSQNGEYLYYAAKNSNENQAMIRRINLKTRQEETLLPGFSPAPLSDNRHLLLTVFDENGLPRLGLADLTALDKPPVFLTDGFTAEGFAHIHKSTELNELVIFSRFYDGEKQPSLWRLDLTRQGNGIAAGKPYPLTSGQGAEIFGTINGDLLFFTSNNEQTATKALPVDGIIPAGITPEILLTLADSTKESALHRMLLRYLISRYSQYEDRARYRLAIFLAEEGHYSEAVNELDRASAITNDPNIKILLGLEKIRYQSQLGCQDLTSDQKKSFLQKQLGQLNNFYQPKSTDPVAIKARYWTVWAELSYQIGVREKLPAIFEMVKNMPGVPVEDIARIQRLWADLAWQLRARDLAVALEQETLALKAPLQKAKEIAIQKLLSQTPSDMSSFVYLRKLVDNNREKGLLAAAALLALGNYYDQHGHPQMAAKVFEELVEKYPDQHKEAALALLQLAKITQEQQHNFSYLDYLQQLITTYPDQTEQVMAARTIIGDNALSLALFHEREGDRKVAWQNFRRIIAGNDHSIIAQRHFITLGAELGQLPDVLVYYQEQLQNNGSSAIYQYCLGLATTYRGSSFYHEAASYLEQALEQEPHFAEALLTRGWLEEEWHRQNTYGGHLEKALDYYNNALTYATEQETIAAANLNLGNGFFLLGKDDLAFASYLARELQQYPFDNKVQKLLFHERFGRVAERLEQHDVALTQLYDAEKLSREDFYSRRGEILLLLAMTHYRLDDYPLAAGWYKQAADFFNQIKRYDKQLTALRAGGYALENAGQYTEAEKLLTTALDLLEKHGGPGNHHYELLEFEIAMEDNNVTRAPYGFDANGEKELLNHKLATLALAKRELKQSRTYLRNKVALLETAAKNRHIGDVVTDDLFISYNDLGRLEALNGSLDEAYNNFLKAYKIKKEQYPLLAIANLLDLTHFDYQLPQSTMSTIWEFWQNRGASCEKAATRSLCLSISLSLVALELAAYKPHPPTDNQALEQLLPMLDHEARILETIFSDIKESGHLAGTTNEKAAVKAIEARFRYLTGDRAAASELLATAQEDADSSLRWRLLLEEALWQNEGQEELLAAAIESLQAAGKELSLATIHSMELKIITQLAFKLLPETANGSYLLALANIWRNLAAKEPLFDFDAQNFAGRIKNFGYLWSQEIFGQWYVLLIQEGSILSFSGTMEESQKWLNQHFREKEYFYVDGPLKPNGNKTILCNSPALLQYSLQNRSFDSPEKPSEIEVPPLTEEEKRLAANDGFRKSTLAAVSLFQHQQWNQAADSFARAIRAMEYLGMSTTLVRERLKESYTHSGQMAQAIEEAVIIRHDYKKANLAAKAAASGYALGFLYYNDKQFEQAATMFSEVAGEYEQLGEKTLAAEAYSRSATALVAQSQFRQAITYYQTAVTLLAGQVTPLRFETERLLAIALENSRDYRNALRAFNHVFEGAGIIGLEELKNNTKLDIIRCQRELGEYDQALLEARLLLHEQAKTNRLLSAQLLLEIARIHWYRGEYKKAQSVSQRALSLAHFLSDSYLELQTYSLKGMIYRNQGEFSKAEQSLRQALLLAENRKSKKEIAAQLNNLGIVYRDQGHIAKSLEILTKALKLDREDHNVEGEAYDLRNLALSQISSLDFSAAHKNLELSLAISQTLSFKYNILECTYALGQLADKEHDNQAAKIYYEQALPLAQDLAAQAIEWRLLLALGKLAWLENDTATASRLLYQSVELVEKLGSASQDGLSPSIQELYGTLIEFLLHNHEAQASLEIMERYRHLGDRQNIKEHYSNELQNPAQGAFLAVFAGQDNLVLWWWDREHGLKTHILPQKTARLKLLIADIQDRFVTFMPVDEQLDELGALLLTPFAEELNQVKELGFATSGILTDLPLAAIRFKQKYLIELGLKTYLLPSLTQKTPDNKFNFNKEIYLAGTGPASQPYTTLEVAAIKNEHDEYIRHAEFSTALQQGLSTTAILHLAGHTRIDGQNIMESGIEVSASQVITLNELLRTPALPPLLVLSSCSLGEGKSDSALTWRRALLQKNEGLILAAGNRVADLSTALLMKYFYRQLLDNNQTPLNALYLAQQTIGAKQAHPAHWATFTLAGRPF